MQALVYSLNRQLQRAYIASNLRYVTLILHGGDGSFLGAPIDVLGIEKCRAAAATRCPQTPRNSAAARLPPRRAARARQHGRRAPLDGAPDRARARAGARTHLGALGRGAGLRARPDDHVPRARCSRPGRSPPSATRTSIGRLARGLVGLGQLVWSKVALAAAVALALGLAIALAFGVVIEIGGVTGGEPWRRLPLLVVGLVLAGGCLGALGALLGALAREARSASLVALLVVMPIVFLGLIPARSCRRPAG